MRIDAKYRIDSFPFKLKVIEAYDFELEPVLVLEQDLIGNKYLSYLVSSDGKLEKRCYLQISKDRLLEIISGDFSLQKAFKFPENNFLFITDIYLENGEFSTTYMIPSSKIADIIPEDYYCELYLNETQAELDSNELIDYSLRKNKVIFDFYLKSENLVNNIKPYAFYKVFTPVIEIIKNMLEIDGRIVDKHLAFSNLRQASLGITIELNYSKDLFLEKEEEIMNNIISLFEAKTKEDFEKLIYSTKDNNYIKHYKSIITSIIKNDSDLCTAYANPITKTVKKSQINKEKAILVKEIIDERFDVIEDIENINGTFLEIDIDRKEPTFKIYSYEDDFTIKGKLELSILDKIKNDLINLGKESYNFVIKTVYQPETTLRSEKIKRFLIDYNKE